MSADQHTLKLVTDMLSSQGCAVRQAQGGVSALQNARATPLELMVLASDLPDLDGYAVCAQLRDDPRTRSIPVIMLGPLHTAFESTRAFAAGAVDVVSSPIVPEELLARVRVHLSNRQIQQQLQEQVALLEHELHERTQAEAALREREQRIRRIGDNLPNGILYQLVQHPNETFEFSYMSGAVEQLTGYTSEQVVANPLLVLDAHHEADQAAYAAAIAESARTLSVFEYEMRQHIADGSLRWRQFYSTPHREPDGTLIWDGICIDITQQKAMEAALREREEYFRLTFEQSPLGVAVLALSYRFAQVNDIFCTITGYTRDELLERDLSAITHRDDIDASLKAMHQVVSGKAKQYTIEQRYWHRGGYLVWVCVHGRVARDPQSQPLHYLALIEDISARKVAEVALRASEERYRRLFEWSMDAIIIANAEGFYIDANQAATELFGIPRDQVIGKPISQVQFAGDLERMSSYQEELAQGGTRGEFVFCRPDGERRVAQYTAVRIGPSFHQSIMRDITDQKAAAAVLEQARLAAEEATRAKSELIAQISHDIRTPMNAVIGLTTLLLTSPLSLNQRDDVENIRRSSNAILTLIDDLLDIAKIEAGKLTLVPQPMPLRACIEEAIDLLASRAEEKQLALHYRADPMLPHAIIGDQTRLRQIVINVLANAVKFTERGDIGVTLAGVPRAASHPDGLLWDITIQVSDTGIGIPANQLDRIFQSFEQASPSIGHTYGGSGLGLTISRHLAELMGGQIEVASTPGAGSTFTIHLPVAVPNTPPPAYLAPHQPVLAGRSMLLVANHAKATDVLTDQLDRWQMTCTVVHSVADGQAWLQAGHPVDGVLLALPDMPRPDQIRAAARNPALPVVQWASVAQRNQLRDSIDHDTTVLLPLPIRPGMLYDTLIHLLQAESGSLKAPIVQQIDPQMGKQHPLRILLAEDHAINQEVTRRLLAMLGYQADMVDNGLAAIAALKRQPYDLVLMDIQMPEMSGTAATHYIRSFWSAAHQPRIVAMTAYASEEHRTYLLSSGMDDYIGKPVGLETLVRVLQATQMRSAAVVSPPDVWHRNRSDGALDSGQFAAFLEGIGEQDSAADNTFLAAYVRAIDDKLQQLGEALATANYEHIAKIAHTLRGLSSQIGATNMALLCKHIEAASETGYLERTTELLDILKDTHTAFEQALAGNPAAKNGVNYCDNPTRGGSR